MTCGDYIEVLDLIVQASVAAGACGAFVVGLCQYNRAQLWRRKEFIGAEVKAFEENPVVRNAFLLIDWSTRRIPFDLTSNSDAWPRVTRELQVSALEPHTLRQIPDGADLESYRRFSPVEVQIRDTYDRFFDGLSRLANFSQAGLFDLIELAPYLGYWFEDLSSEDGPNEDQRWKQSLFAYIQFYRFRAVQTLFDGLGYDISVKGKAVDKAVQGGQRPCRKARESMRSSLTAACTARAGARRWGDER